MHDDEGHTGIVNGVIRHRFFDNFDLDLTASEMRGVKVLQTATKQALPIYGTAYGTGTAQMKGKLPKLLLRTLEPRQRKIRLTCLKSCKLLRALLHEAIAENTRYRADRKADPKICL